MTTYDPTTIEQLDTYDAFTLGESLLADRRPRDAARMLQVVVERAPEQSSGWELLGRAHFAAAHLKPAEDAFRRLVELEPTSAWAHTALGLALDRQSRHAEGAGLHRLAAALGDSTRDHTRVELVDANADDAADGPIVIDLSDRLG